MQKCFDCRITNDERGSVSYKEAVGDVSIIHEGRASVCNCKHCICFAFAGLATGRRVKGEHAQLTIVTCKDAADDSGTPVLDVGVQLLASQVSTVIRPTQSCG